MNTEQRPKVRKKYYRVLAKAFNKLRGKWRKESRNILIPKSTLKITKFIHNTKSMRKLLKIGHRWRGDVDVIELCQES